MLRTLIIGLFTAVILTAQTTGAESSVRGVVAKYVAARDAADEKALVALFTEDADQLVSSGEWRRGRAEVVRGTLAASRSESGATRTIAVESVRFLSPEIAVADGRYEIAGTASAARRMWACLVLKLTPDGWRIAAIRNMLPAPPAP